MNRLKLRIKQVLPASWTMAGVAHLAVFATAVLLQSCASSKTLYADYDSSCIDREAESINEVVRRNSRPTHGSQRYFSVSMLTR